MNKRDLQAREIEAGENWLKAILGGSEFRGKEQLAQRLRIEIEELQLAEALQANQFFDTSRVKEEVQVEIKRLRADRCTNSPLRAPARYSKWAAGVLGIAAVMTLFLIRFESEFKADVAMEPDEFEWSALDEEFTHDAWDEDYAQLQSQLGALSDAFAAGWLADEELDLLNDGI